MSFFLSEDATSTTAASLTPGASTSDSVSPTSTTSGSTTSGDASASATPAELEANRKHRSDVRTIVIATVVPSVVALIALVVFLLWRWREKRKQLGDELGSFTYQEAAHIPTMPVERIMHYNNAPPELLPGSSNISLGQEQQQPTDNASTLIDPYTISSAQTASIPVRSKTTRTGRTSLPEYNALFPTE